METINGSTTQRSTRAFYSTLRPRAGADILKHSAYGALYGVAESLLAGSAMVRRLTARQTAVEAMRGESSHAGGVRGSHGSIHGFYSGAMGCILYMRLYLVPSTLLYHAIVNQLRTQ